MKPGYLIGLDFGTLSARGVLVCAITGKIEASHTHAYRHGVMNEALPDGAKLPPLWALQNAPDYTEAAEAILGAVGRGKIVHGIGLGFTASSPLPARADGAPLSVLYPDDPHAYVKLWKHQSAQAWAARINAAGGDFLRDFGGKLSAEWLLAKAAQIADEAPTLWAAADRFIEAGDWLVWQLTGQEVRSLGFAAYKAQFVPGVGYPQGIVPHLREKLSDPVPVGRAAGALTAAWRERTGVLGSAIVAVAVIDSHVVMPAVGAIEPGVLVGALGTSAAFLLLDDRARPLPAGIEGVAKDGVLPGLWCYEAGQAAFGDTLDWFVRTFPKASEPSQNFAEYNAAAALLAPGQNQLVALDWWNGCRVPLGDSSLSGLLVGLNLKTTAAGIYRALLESLCYGTRNIVEHLSAGGAPLDRILLTSGLSQNNPLLMQLMANVLGRDILVPRIDHATAVGAAIHGAVAAGVVDGYAEGAQRYGATSFLKYETDKTALAAYEILFKQYQILSGDRSVRESMHAIGAKPS
ncbi:FGGY-family carbohydrate kinase [Methylocapsa sp. S129]|uniref:FGGY-family carbohydrate kinase n=1 Tax=Methylocapsa sp. S129 TaxID=1641869 RepID=UPI00131A9E44|nr:FGGY-family carbohydrate kinase [Methylocapsa sp. S129]